MPIHIELSRKEKDFVHYSTIQQLIDLAVHTDPLTQQGIASALREGGRETAIVYFLDSIRPVTPEQLLFQYDLLPSGSDPIYIDRHA